MARDKDAGLTLVRLKEVLRYDPDTGEWTWRRKLSARRVAGSRAGTINDSGYRLISVDGFDFRGHRLAWFYMTGTWPPEQIDHINGDRADNRWVNLRLATEQQNKANTKVSANCKSGFKGVFWSKQRNKWAAKISPDGRQVHLGFHERIEDAAAAYEAAAKKFFGEFGRAA